ncbi:hypothetical protein NEPAR05_0581, partial [Nematocida parisii]
HTIYGHVYTKNKAGGLSMRRSGDWFNRVNYISQSAVDYENVPARSILVSIAKCNGMAEADVDNYMNTFGIERAKNVIFKNLSHEEKKILSVIGGMLSIKEMNIWGEPLNGLNAELTRNILSHIKKFSNTNVVALNHVPKILLDVFDYVIVMYNSAIIYSGPVPEADEYFVEMGVEFPKDVFYADYLMQLIAGRVTNEKDKNNIAVLRKMWNEISKVPRGPRRSSSSSCWLSQAKISFTRVREIIGLSLYSNKLFRGSSFLITTLLIVVLCSIVLFNTFYILCEYLAVDSNGLNPNYKYATTHITLFYPHLLYCFLQEIKGKIHYIDQQYNYFSLKNINKVKIISALIGKMNEYYKVINNISWVSILSQTFNLFFLFVGSLVCMWSSNGFHSPSFYKTSKFNIKEKRFTAGDYTCALIINSLLQKTLVLWSVSIIVYWGLYLTVNCKIVESATNSIGHLIPITLLLCASFLIGVYSLLIEFAPIPIRWLTFTGVLYVLICQLLPVLLVDFILMDVDSEFIGLYTPFSRIISIFYSESEYSDKKSILKAFNISPSDGYYNSPLLDWIITIYKTTMRYNPNFFFSHMLAKISYYLEDIKVNKEITNSGFSFNENDLIYEIAKCTWGRDSTDLLDLPTDVFNILFKYKSNRKMYGAFDCHNELIQILKKCESICPVEVFDPEHSLVDMSFSHILWSAFCFWAVPTSLLLLFILYAYKKLLFRVRN